MISIVVAMDKNRVIGRENKIPWHIKSDLKRLASLTRGHTVILGRKSYDSMAWYYNRSGKQMPGAHYVVVTRNSRYTPHDPKVHVAHSISDAITTAEGLGDDTILAIGGGQVFTEILPHTSQIYLTEVQASVGGDSFFPELDPHDWQG
jgi:dihydrofolate reductase